MTQTVEEQDPRLPTEVPAVEENPAVIDRMAAFDAAIGAHRSEQDRLLAVERGELPRSMAPRAPRIVRWCDVPEYDGFQYRAYLNFPQRLMLDLQSGEESRIRTALQSIIIDHNGWCDADGSPYPEAADASFWDAIPTHLAIRIVRGINEEIRSAPLALPRSNS